MAPVVKNPPSNADVRDSGSIPGSGRSPGGGNGTPLLYSCQKNPIDSGAWRSLAGYSPWGLKESDMTEHPDTWIKELMITESE